MRNTKEKIADAAIRLFAEKGFNGVTTKEISDAAGVSEVTLFRLYENKRNLYQCLIKENLHPYQIQRYLEEDVTYDLETDLRNMAGLMQSTLKKNLPFIKMIVKDHHANNEHKTALGYGFKKSLEAYFHEMHERGALREPPEYALKFYITNIAHAYYEIMFRPGVSFDPDYFNWLVKKVIDAIKRL